MTTFSSSQVVSREGRSTNAPPPAIATATTGLVGVTQKGPIGEATLTTSFGEWRATYGDPTAESFAAYVAAEGFFAEGGRYLYTSRVVHLDVNGDPDTADFAEVTVDTSASAPTSGVETGSIAGPWNVTPGTTITVAVDGGAPSGPATFSATRAAPASTVNGNGLADGDEIEVIIGSAGEEDYGPQRGVTQTITFNAADFAAIATPTDVELAAVINDQLVGGSAVPDGLGFVLIRDDVFGTASRVRVAGANAALFAWPADTAGTGTVANAARVSSAEFIALVDAVTTGIPTVDGSGFPLVTSPTTGGGSSIQLGGTALAAFGFDALLHSGSAGSPTPTLTFSGRWEGEYAADVTVEVSAASSGVASEFNLTVRYLGERRETFTNCTMDTTSPRYVVDVLAKTPGVGSSFIAATNELADLGSALLDRPANGTYALVGGDDGLTGLVDADFTGNATNKKGIYAFDYTSDLRLLVIPGRPTSVVQNAALVYCELVRNGSVVAILDPPEGMTAAEVVEWVRTTASLYNSSEFGIMYWPRIRVLNPDPTVFGTAANLVAAPSGHIAGIYARNDSGEVGGVYKPAGGFAYGRLRTIVGLETIEVEDVVKRDLVAAANINPISTQSGQRALDDVLMLRTNSNFPTIGERRGAIFIKLSIAALLEEYRLRNNDAELRDEVNRRVTQFLEAQFANKAFRGTTPAESFYVNTSDELNNDAVVDAGRLLVEVGIATQRPARFIELTISQDLRQQAIVQNNA